MAWAPQNLTGQTYQHRREIPLRIGHVALDEGRQVTIHGQLQGADGRSGTVDPWTNLSA